MIDGIAIFVLLPNEPINNATLKEWKVDPWRYSGKKDRLAATSKGSTLKPGTSSEPRTSGGKRGN
jgi:hypothetical protein